METIINQSMFANCTDEGLLATKALVPGDTALCTLIDSILASRKAELEAKKVAENFNKAMEVIVGKLPNPPSGVYNFYSQFKAVEVEDVSKPKEECDVVVDGKPSKVKRHPMIQKQQWIVTVNHACKLNGSGSANATGNSADASHKRAITVKQLAGDKLAIIGNFRNGSEACKHLKLDTNGDSANRVLANNKFYTEAYPGNEYTVKV
jgi:hypothetical protein